MNMYLVLLLLNSMQFTFAYSYVYALATKSSNLTSRKYRDKEAEFGNDIPPDDGMKGVLYLAKPVNACTEVPAPNSEAIYPYTSFLLVEESKSQKTCSYSHQVSIAQRAGYAAVIVYRRIFDDVLVTMTGDGPYIPSVYVTKETGEDLKFYLHSTDATIEIISVPEFPLQLYLIPFAVVVGICFFFMIMFSIGRYIRYRMTQRRSRLSPANLKKIPTKKFKKGDEYDLCAICIEEYEENEKIRILPCNHAYHCKCVDPWLTSGKKLCPICKRSVDPDTKKKKKKKNNQTFDGASTSSQHTATESEPHTESETDDNDNDERTPLLSNQQNISSSGAIDV